MASQKRPNHRVLHPHIGVHGLRCANPRSTSDGQETSLFRFVPTTISSQPSVSLPNASGLSPAQSESVDAPSAMRQTRSNSTLSPVEISELEREIESTKNKSHALKDKLQFLRHDEIQRLKAKLDFHIKVSERSRQMQIMKTIGMHFGRKTSMYRAEVFHSWRRMTQNSVRQKRDAEAKAKQTTLLNASLIAFSSRSRWMTLTYVIQIWIKFVGEEKEDKRENKRRGETLALEIKRVTAAKKTLMSLLHGSDCSVINLYFSQWKMYIFGKCRAEKATNKASQEAADWKARFNKVKFGQFFAIVKWMGRSRCQLIIDSWRRIAADNKMLRRAETYEAEVKKLKLVSIPLLLATVEGEARIRWRNRSYELLARTINTQVKTQLHTQNWLTAALAFRAWQCDSKAARHATSIGNLNTAMRRQSQVWEAQIFATRKSITDEMTSRLEDDRKAQEKEKKRVEDLSKEMAHAHKAKFEGLKNEYEQKLQHSNVQARETLYKSVSALENEVIRHKERGLAVQNELMTSHQLEISRLKEECFAEKAKQVEASKQEHLQNTEHLTKRLETAERRIKELEDGAEELKNTALVAVAERDGAKRELDMYQGEYRQLFRQFSTYRERAEELDRVQKADIVSLEQFIESRNVPGGAKFLLGRPVQIGATYVNKGQVVPIFNKDPLFSASGGLLSPRTIPPAYSTTTVQSPTPRTSLQGPDMRMRTPMPVLSLAGSASPRMSISVIKPNNQ